MKVWKVGILYEMIQPPIEYSTMSISGKIVNTTKTPLKKQQIQQLDIWEEEIIETEYKSVYQGAMETRQSLSNPVFVFKTEKEAYKSALTHCVLVEDEPNIMYDFKPMKTRQEIIRFCTTYYPELLC